MVSFPSGGMRSISSSSQTYSFLQEELDWLYSELRQGVEVPNLIAELLEYDSPEHFSRQIPAKERALIYYAVAALAPVDLRPVIEQHMTTA